MSPARSKRTPVPQRRTRGEIVRSVAVVVGVIAITAVVIWLLRPGPAGTVGTGGLSNRQPRSSGLVFGTLLVGGIVTWYVLRVSRRARGHEKVVLPIALGVVLVGAVVVGIVWPDGLLRHEQAPAPRITPATTPTTLPTSTTGTASTTAPPGTPTTTTPTTTTPTTGTATTTSP